MSDDTANSPDHATRGSCKTVAYKRTTFTIDDELDRKVREHQARTMLATGKAYSYSDAINDLLAKSL